MDGDSLIEGRDARSDKKQNKEKRSQFIKNWGQDIKTFNSAYKKMKNLQFTSIITEFLVIH